jgi:hypothetical protein
LTAPGTRLTHGQVIGVAHTRGWWTLARRRQALSKRRPRGSDDWRLKKTLTCRSHKSVKQEIKLKGQSCPYKYTRPSIRLEVGSSRLQM